MSSSLASQVLSFVPSSLTRPSSFVYPVAGSLVLSLVPLALLNTLHRLKRKQDPRDGSAEISVDFPDYVMSPLVSFAAGALFAEAFVHTVAEILASRIASSSGPVLSVVEDALLLVLHGMLLVFAVERVVAAVAEALSAHQKRRILKSLLKYKYRMERRRRGKRSTNTNTNSGLTTGGNTNSKTSDALDDALLGLDDETFRNLEDEALEEDLDKAVNSDSTTDDQLSPRPYDDQPPRRQQGLRSASSAIEPTFTSSQTLKRSVKGVVPGSNEPFRSSTTTRKHTWTSPATTQLQSQALLQALGTFIHCITDGITLTLAFQTSLASGGAAWLALGLHELPHKFGQYATYVRAGHSHESAVQYLLLGSLGTVLGAVGSFVAAHLLGGDGDVSGAGAFQTLQLYAAGGMVYLGCTGILAELSHSGDDHDHGHEPSPAEQAAEFRAEIKRLSEARNKESTREKALLPVLRQHIYRLLPDILSSKSPLGILLNAGMQIVFVFVGIKASMH